MLQSSQLVLGACRSWQQAKSSKIESATIEIKDHHSWVNQDERIKFNEINSVNSCKTTRNVAGLEKSWNLQKSRDHCDNDDLNQTESLTSENNILDICKASQDAEHSKDPPHVTPTDDNIFAAAKVNGYRTKESGFEPSGIQQNKSLILEPSLSPATGENIKTLSLLCGTQRPCGNTYPGATRNKDDIIVQLSDGRISEIHEISSEARKSKSDSTKENEKNEKINTFPAEKCIKTEHNEISRQISCSSIYEKGGSTDNQQRGVHTAGTPIKHHLTNLGSYIDSTHLAIEMGQTAMSSPSLIMLGQLPHTPENIPKGMDVTSCAFNRASSEEFPTLSLGKSPKFIKRSEVIAHIGGENKDDSELFNNRPISASLQSSKAEISCENFDWYPYGVEGATLKSPSCSSPTPPPPHTPPPDLPAAPPPAQGEWSGPDLTIASPQKGDILLSVVRHLENKDCFLETHFEWVPSPPSLKREGHQNMVDSVLLSERGLDGSEAKPWVERGEI